jgi:hypothetical protein
MRYAVTSGTYATIDVQTLIIRTYVRALLAVFIQYEEP